ncbi:MAG: hypothetical protein Tsb0013_08190 [Phycisphaerales bacterium]
MPRVPLQQFEHDRSTYERPNLDWVCGRAACGKPCALGPDHTGGCHTTAECVPTRSGDRWICARPGALGGACEAGPRPDGTCCRPIVPCTPVRSLRSVRGSIVRWTAAAALGVVLLMLGLPGSDEVFTPGPLTNAHASLMTRDIQLAGASQCSACHADSNSTTAQIIRTNAGEGQVPPASGVGPVLSEKCMECHAMGAHAKRAHALNPSQLSQLTDDSTPGEARLPLGLRLARAADVGVHALHASGEAIECVACHTEHHGSGFDIAKLSDTQCQTCHTQAFAAFDAGHPPFDDYPYNTPAQIRFNHATHINTHFNAPEHADTPYACMTCHEPDPVGSAMLVRGYEASCMDCHEGQIMGEGRASLQGVAFFTLPPIDVRSLEDEGRWIGAWPADSAIYAGGVTPFMRLLLAGDEAVSRALARTGEKALRDLYEADEATLDDAETIAWGVKRLVRDILAGGQGEVRARIERALRRPMTSDEAASILAGLPINAMVGARDEWFPELHHELAMHAAGTPPQPEPDQAPETQTPDAEADTQQATGDDLFTDSVLDDSDADLLGGSDDLLAGDDDLLGGSDDLLEGDDDLLAGSDDLLAGDDDLLASPDDASDLLGGSDDLLGGDDDLLGGDDDLLGGDDDLLAGNDDTSTATQIEAEPFVLPDPQEWVRYGGWFLLDAETLSLVYRPTGHADAFMRAWLDLSAPRVIETPGDIEPTLALAHSGAEGVFNELADRGAPGVCMKCHTVDDAVPGAQHVNWYAVGPDPAYTTFTRFAHRPHLTDLGDNACASCHQVADLLPPEAPADRPQACFAPQSIDACQSCHNASHVDTSCLGCHNYHVGVRHVRAWGGALDSVNETPTQGEDGQPPQARGRVPFWRTQGLASGR